MCELRVFLWCIGLVNYIGHPQPPQLNWARVCCGLSTGTHPCGPSPRQGGEGTRAPALHTLDDVLRFRGDEEYIELCSYIITDRKKKASKGYLLIPGRLKKIDFFKKNVTRNRAGVCVLFCVVFACVRVCRCSSLCVLCALNVFVRVCLFLFVFFWERRERRARAGFHRVFCFENVDSLCLVFFVHLFHFSYPYFNSQFDLFGASFLVPFCGAMWGFKFGSLWAFFWGFCFAGPFVLGQGRGGRKRGG